MVSQPLEFVGFGFDSAPLERCDLDADPPLGVAEKPLKPSSTLPSAAAFLP